MKKTHPLCRDEFDRSVHAEIRAIIICNKEDIEGSTMYVYREHQDSSPALARPCNMCYNYMKQKGIKKVVYTVGEPPYYKVERII